MPTKAVLSWSGGKDSTMALYEIQRAGDWEIQGLLTTIVRENRFAYLDLIPSVSPARD